MRAFSVGLALVLFASCGSESGDLLDTSPYDVFGDRPKPELSSDVQFASLLNNVRISAGVGTLAYDGQLGAAAQDHAADMLALDYFSHVSQDGSTLRDRVDAAGYDWTAIAENIAKGQTTQEAVLEAWENSPGHHANNISPAYEDFGFGIAGTGNDTRWVLVFGHK